MNERVTLSFDFRKFLPTGLLWSLMKYNFNITSLELEGECSSIFVRRSMRTNMLQFN